jgi:hypothetical protein
VLFRRRAVGAVRDRAPSATAPAEEPSSVAAATAAVAEHIGRIALLGLGVAPGRTNRDYWVRTPVTASATARCAALVDTCSKLLRLRKTFPVRLRAGWLVVSLAGRRLSKGKVPPSARATAPTSGSWVARSWPGLRVTLSAGLHGSPIHPIDTRLHLSRAYAHDVWIAQKVKNFLLSAPPDLDRSWHLQLAVALPRAHYRASLDTAGRLAA